MVQDLFKDYFETVLNNIFPTLTYYPHVIRGERVQIHQNSRTQTQTLLLHWIFQPNLKSCLHDLGGLPLVLVRLFVFFSVCFVFFIHPGYKVQIGNSPKITANYILRHKTRRENAFNFSNRRTIYSLESLLCHNLLRRLIGIRDQEWQ